jgi:predicted alpha/beta hydrolase family esterase
VVKYALVNLTKNMELGNEGTEKPRQLKDVNFYVVPGGMSPTIQEWQNDFGELINNMGIKKENIHLSHLTNINKPRTYFGPYKDWRKSSNLPINPEESKNSVIIAHSSGAELAMIWAEHHKNLGLILFSPYVNSNVGPLGNSYLEKYSGMFSKTNKDGEKVNREFDWERISKNSNFVIIVHSENDKLVSVHQSFNVYKKIRGGTENNNIIFINSKVGGHYPVKSQLTEVMKTGKIFESLVKNNLFSTNKH